MKKVFTFILRMIPLVVVGLTFPIALYLRLIHLMSNTEALLWESAGVFSLLLMQSIANKYWESSFNKGTQLYKEQSDYLIKIAKLSQEQTAQIINDTRQTMEELIKTKDSTEDAFTQLEKEIEKLRLRFPDPPQELPIKHIDWEAWRNYYLACKEKRIYITYADIAKMTDRAERTVINQFSTQGGSR